MRSRRLRHPRHPRRRRRAAACATRAILYYRAPPRDVRTVAAKSRRHLPPALFSRHVTGGGAALPVPTHRLVTALLPPRRRRGARHV